MGKTRLEAFSDGVIAIIITIMVLELEAPEGRSLAALAPLVHVFLGYVLSFAFVGVYWFKHHQLLAVPDRIEGRALWANLHFLFWLSLLPFATDWIGESRFAPLPVAVYGGAMLMTAAGFRLLRQSLRAETPGQASPALGAD